MISVVIPRASNELCWNCAVVQHGIYLETVAFRSTYFSIYRSSHRELLSAKSKPPHGRRTLFTPHDKALARASYFDLTFLRFTPYRAQQALASEFVACSFPYLRSSACLFASFSVFTFITWL